MNRSVLRFSLIATGCLAIIILVSAFWLPQSFFANTVPILNRDGAKEALLLLKDWTIWMASLQTATVAALGLLAKDGAPTLKLSDWQMKLAVLVALLNTVALFFSAWLLTSLSSLMLRLYTDGLAHYDFYNFKLYAYMERHASLDPFTVGFFAFWNHWLWAVGILVFGALSISLVVRRSST